MQVTIGGVPYAPACVISSRIGIAITTHQRADVLKRVLEQHMKHLPVGALVVVVDDGSKPASAVPDGVQLLRHETSLVIVTSKNASLSAMMDAGCEHIFLWDDDAWPITHNWHLSYIESQEPHLGSFTTLCKATGKRWWFFYCHQPGFFIIMGTIKLVKTRTGIASNHGRLEPFI